MIWRLLDAGLCRLVGWLLRLSPVEPMRPEDVISQDEEAARRRVWPESPR